MINIKKKNTKHGGILRFFLFFDKKAKEFVGVSMDIGIIKCGDNPYFVEKDLIDSSLGYIENVCENDLPDYLLNEGPPQEYIDLFDKYQRLVSSNKKKEFIADFEEARTFIKIVPSSLCLTT